jgi:putative iron-only hydrogenase system regulator
VTDEEAGSEQGEAAVEPRPTERRFGFVGIIVSHSSACGPEIQRILSDCRDLIQGRMGLPHLSGDSISVITLIVHATPEELGGMTGRLGRLKDVAVKSGLAPV